VGAAAMRAVGAGETSLGTNAPLAAAALVADGVELVVVGGCALVIVGLADRCSDLDVVPRPECANLVRLGAALDALGATRPGDRAIRERPVTSASSPFGRIDLMVATARSEYDALAGRATAYRVAGVAVPIAAVDDVLRLRAAFRANAG
jgi:hypothetical protein